MAILKKSTGGATTIQSVMKEQTRTNKRVGNNFKIYWQADRGAKISLQSKQHILSPFDVPREHDRINRQRGKIPKASRQTCLSRVKKKFEK